VTALGPTRSLTDLTKRESLRHWPADRRLGGYGVLNSTWEVLA
jgi:hypothetical protein